jgi:hypothetical protein
MSMPFRHQSVSDLDKFWVVAVVSNPIRYKTRYELFQNFKIEMAKAGVNLFVVEIAYGERSFECTTGAPNELQLRTRDEIWHKENMINLALARLPPDFKYVAWIDGDCHFVRQDWAEETVHQLQHYSFVQMFENAIDLGPDGECLTVFEGFGSSFIKGRQYPTPVLRAQGVNEYYGPLWHPGFAWAARRDAIEAVGGLIDFSILGAADHQQSLALIGKAEYSLPGGVHSDYRDMVMQWQERCRVHRLIGDIGYTPGTLCHNWHGKKGNRKYIERWSILVDNKFSPLTDLKKDSQGLYRFTDAGLRMRNEIRAYMRQRSEDDVVKD